VAGDEEREDDRDEDGNRGRDEQPAIERLEMLGPFARDEVGAIRRAESASAA